MPDHNRITQKALWRFQIISAYLAADPPRGKRRQMLEELAAKTWLLESGEVVTVKAETIRYWLRIYERKRRLASILLTPKIDQIFCPAGPIR